MAHKVMPPPFTSEQLEMIEGMIEKAISDHDDTLDWSSDIEDAVQSAASDARSDIRGVESSIEALEDKGDGLEGRVDGLENE